MQILDGIKFNIDKIANNKKFQLARIGSTPLLSPVTNAIIFYCKFCGVPKLSDRNDIEELWFRIIYLRRFGFSIYQTNSVFDVHFFEPFYPDIQEHLGLEVDCAYAPRKQWINQKIEVFVEYNTQMCNIGQVKYALQETLEKRDKALPDFIKQETNIDISSLAAPAETPKEEEINPIEKKEEQPVDPNVNPHPIGSPEWHIKEHQLLQMKADLLKPKEKTEVIVEGATKGATDAPKNEPTKKPNIIKNKSNKKNTTKTNTKKK